MSGLTIPTRRRRTKEEGRSGNENQNTQLNVLDVEATGKPPAEKRPPNDGVSSEPGDKGAAESFVKQRKRMAEERKRRAAEAAKSGKAAR